LPDFVEILSGDFFFEDADSAARGCQQPVELVEKGGFARAVGSEDGDIFAFLDDKVDVVQRFCSV
jgi:hypothetical protein